MGRVYIEKGDQDMTENRWDRIWNRDTFREVYDVETGEPKSLIVINKDWLHEVKTTGDAINSQLEAVRNWMDKQPTYGLNFIDTYEKLAIATADWSLKLMKILRDEEG